jgi:hypothetical protein
MNRRAIVVLAVIGWLGGCGRNAAERAGASEPARRLTGEWDVRFIGTALKRGAVPAARPTEVRGAIALVANRRLENAPGLDTPTNVGTFDLDFTPLGFDLRDPVRAPVALAVASGSDSVRLAMGSGRALPTVMMLGTWADDSLVGEWHADLGRVSGVRGSFVMRRRRSVAGPPDATRMRDR